MSALAKYPERKERASPDEDRDLLLEIRTRRDEAAEADEDNSNAAKHDLKFLAGDQWPEGIKQERENDERPVVTENNLNQFVRQVVGDMRAQRPAIKVNPDGDGAEKEVAEIYTGLIRDIEAKAATKRPYITAGASAARCGIGHWRVTTDYESDRSFDQCIKIEPIDNPFSVLWDPLATTITREDATYCFVTYLLSEEEFERQYPDAKVVDFESTESWANDWLDRASNSVRVAEYWRKKPKKRKLVELGDGFIGFEDELDDKGLLNGPVVYRRERVVDSFEVECIKTNGFEVLEEPRIWPTRHIPIIAVVGEEYNVGEKRVRHSVIRFAKDSQQMLNYWLSTQTEYVALQPKSPYIATAQQIAAYKTDWVEANIKNRPVLVYEHVPGVPPPQRAQPPLSASGIADQIVIAKEALRSTTGIYDAGLGKKSNETSGVAIAQRQRESDVGTSEYLDNLAASIAYTGEIIVDLIPKIYDTARQVRVLGEDGSETFKDINQRMQTPEGEKLINALSRGKYAITVTTGPSYTTKRQEAAESMLAFVQANPQAASIVLDLIAKNMDWPGAEQFAERFKKTLPPNLQPETDDPKEQEARQTAMQQAQEAEQVQKQMLALQMAEKEASVMKTKAEAQKLLMPEAQRQIDPLEAQKLQNEHQAQQAEHVLKAGEMELQAKELAIKERELALREAELSLRAQEIAAQERIEMARMADQAAGREADLKREERERLRSQGFDVTEPAGEGQAQPLNVAVVLSGLSTALESMGDGMRALAEAQLRPKRIVRDPQTGMALGTE